MNASKFLPGLGVSGVSVVSMVISLCASANGYLVEANVIDTQPVYRSVQINNPVQQCWQEAVSVPQNQTTSYTPEILGAIVGAGVGRFFGSGRGQDVATVAGAVLGGSVGRDAKNRYNQKNSTVQYVQQCKTVDNFHTQQQIDGYNVTYEYEGQTYTTRTNSNPGDTITLSVSFIPVET